MKRIVALCLAAACLISMVGCAGDTNMDEKKPNNSASAYALALASYPEMAPYPNEMEYFDEKTGEFDSDGFDVVYDAWQSDRKAQRSQPEGYADGRQFNPRVSQQFQRGEQGILSSECLHGPRHAGRGDGQ